ncbi:hypothetical protein FFLO_03875 [Filobasidium floriforme]|uniref:Uncharacterized protein n=1 Tax=Filobasidium floriforme TaxID=5210 RepID=A0A8K0JJY4_9TREE|nr:uncharacterized protein HD553DRAFT_352932 [Filobasidium floriforme]KAG7532067.1 hypothetical protein FFLO_03875 [Filobasidium floriforme]KAH8078601.1 hypothetical protein HD553DRAFT_352932 [Filobasidium floriforme]
MDHQMDDQAHDTQSLEGLETHSDLTNAYEEHFCGYSNSDSEPDNTDNEEPDDVRRETSDEPPFKELEIDLEWVNQKEEECDPEDSISQFTPPRLASLKVKAPPSNATDLTAGGQTPEHYFYLLMKADMRALLEPIPPSVHCYLVGSFDALATEAEDPAVKPAVSRLVEIRKLYRDQTWSKFDLQAAMQELLRDYLNALDLDLENGSEPKEAKPRFVVRSPEEWNRLPLDLKDQVDLSAPKVDILVGLNPANPSAVSASHNDCHPLSPEANLRILKNPATRDFAPNKSTLISDDCSSLHDLFIIQMSRTGSWQKDGSRSTEMQIAQAQAMNACYFQLGAMVDLYDHARSPTDVGPDPRYFVLAMTVCGEEWTVEYATWIGPMVLFTTLTRGSWAQDPTTFLHAIQEVLLHSLVYMEEKMARMGELLRVPGPANPSSGKVELQPRTYGISAEMATRRAAKTRKQLEEQEREAKELESQKKATKQQAGKRGRKLTAQPVGRTNSSSGV